jgi:hypothetical protein
VDNPGDHEDKEDHDRHDSHDPTLIMISLAQRGIRFIRSTLKHTTDIP